MKYLKRYNQLNENQSNIDSICLEFGIENYSINPDGSIDVDGDVVIRFRRNLYQLPLKFRKVTGNFDISYNKLTSLEGCPNEVGGDFDCSNNELSSLIGSPDLVGVDFVCGHNPLTSLTGCPTEVRNFYCNDTELSNLVGAPKKVYSFYGRSNLKLNSILGFPDQYQEYVLRETPVYKILQVFIKHHKLDKFIERINHFYPELWIGDGWTIQGDILEQIAEDLDINLDELNWRDTLEDIGYKII